MSGKKFSGKEEKVMSDHGFFYFLIVFLYLGCMIPVKQYQNQQKERKL